jgi:hypothetical protein
MKLYPRKGGHGHITAYMMTLGSAEARRVNFLNEDGTSKELEKVIDEKAGIVIIRVKPSGTQLP